MKKLIAMALFFVSAMTMSAQSVQIIQNSLIKDADISAALENPNYALVDIDDPALKAAVEEINKKVNNNLELDREGALDALDAAIKDLEMQAGDVNLDGKFNIRDVNQLNKDLNNSGSCYDFNKDGKTNIRDVNALNNKLNSNS